jgi:hypothetical protein
VTKAPKCTVCDYLKGLMKRDEGVIDGQYVGAQLALQAHEQMLHPDKNRTGVSSAKPPDTE